MFSPSPFKIFCGGYHTMVLMNDGKLYATGFNGYGQLALGLGNQQNKSALTQVTSITYTDTNGLTQVTPITGKTISNVFCGANHTMVLMTDGTLYAAGRNDLGQLGLGHTNITSSLTKVTPITGKTISNVFCGANHTMVLMTDGTLYATGYNTWGQLGLGNQNPTNSLTQVTSITGTISNISGGEFHTMVLMTDGTLYATGRNNLGQLGLGNNSNTIYTSFTQVPYIAGKTISNVFCGGNHTMVLMTDRTLYATGRNDVGQLGLGNNNITKSLTPVTLITGKTISNVFCGEFHTMVLMTDGTLYVTGYNNDGQLGLGTTDSSKNVLTQVTSIPGIINISCGAYHTMVLMFDGTLYATGQNDFGQLGLGNNNDTNNLTRVSHITGKTISNISCGAYHTMVLMSDRTLYATGYNGNGHLGLGTNDISKNSLTKVTPIIGKTISNISCGGYHTMVLMTDGTLYATGYNGNGELGLGNNNSTISFLPVTSITGTISNVFCGGYHTMVLMNDGTLYATGYNGYGQLGLGLGNNPNKNVLTQVTSITYTDINGLTQVTPITGKTISNISCGETHTMVLMTDGTLYATGFNGYGQLGLGLVDNPNKNVLTQVTSIPGTISNVFCGLNHTIVLMTDGTLYVTGQNNLGQLGLGNNNNTNIFLPVTSITGTISNISCGETHTMVLMTDGTLYATGYNGYGQLGLGLVGNTNKNSLTRVSYITGKTISNVFCGGHHTMVLINDRTLYATGRNNFGQLGLGNNTDTNNLTRVSYITGKTISNVFCGEGHTMVLKTDRTLYATGNNGNGQLGFGLNDTSKNSLTQVPYIAGKTISNISCGGKHTMVLMTDGTLYATGYNEYGQLGLGNNNNTNSLTQVTSITGIISNVSCGGYHTMVLMFDGKLYATGSNNNGQLGLGLNDTSKNILTQVPYIAGKTISNVFCGGNHTMVLMTDGTLYATGRNNFGQLGLGHTGITSSLTQVTPITGKTISSVSCGEFHTMVLMTDGTLYATGYNNTGQLGLGYTGITSSLTEVTSIPGTIINISCGAYHTMVLMFDGTLYATGYNNLGQLGISSSGSTSNLTLVTLIAGKTIINVSCGLDHTIVLMTDGTLYATGSNNYGQLGLGLVDNPNKNVFTQFFIDNLVLYYPFDVDKKNYSSGIVGSVESFAKSDTVYISTNFTFNTLGSLYFPGGSNPSQEFRPLPPTSEIITQLTGMTFSVWVRFISFPPLKTEPNFRIFDFRSNSFGTETDDNPVILYFANNPEDPNQLQFHWGGINYIYPLLNNIKMTMNDNLWHNYCVTISPVVSNNYTITIYVDNINVVSNSFSTSNKGYPTLPFNTCIIGNSSYRGDRTNTQPSFNVNNFRLYNKQLTSTEINNLYLTESSGKLTLVQHLNTWGLLLYYPFNGDALNYASGSGVNDAQYATTYSNDNSTSIFEGGSSYLIGSKLEDETSGNTTRRFNGKSITLVKSGFTVACWMKLKGPKPTTGHSRIFDIGKSGTQDPKWWSIVYYWWLNDLHVALKNGDGGSKTIMSMYQTFTTGWHHYCLVYDGSKLRGYFDGLNVYDRDDVAWTGNDTVLDRVYIGENNDVESNNNLAYANYNSFMVFNRPIPASEIGLIMGTKNTIINGMFNSFLKSSDDTTNGRFSLNNNTYTTKLLSVSGWAAIKLSQTNETNATAFITSGTSNTVSHLLNFNERYNAYGLQFSSNMKYVLHQFVYLEVGTYLFKYKACGRVGYYSVNHKLTSSIIYLNSPLEINDNTLVDPSQQTISTTQITNYSSIFTVNYNTKALVLFKFTSDATVSDSIIFISGVEIVPISQRFLYNNTALGTNFGTFDVKNTVIGYKPLSTIMTTNYNIPGVSDLFKNRPLYMHGPRNSTGYLINGIDMGRLFQNSSHCDGSYGYCFTVNHSSIEQTDNLRNSQLIWPENSAVAQGIQQCTYWLYHTFYYSGSNTSGKLYVIVDNSATFYLNSTFISSSITFNGGNSIIINLTNIVNGLNYIRVAVANDNTNLAGFMAAIYDSSNNLIATTDSTWTYSVVKGKTSTTYNEVEGWLPFATNVV
jgi:alpha-tubulin suppressor-like RCC1 family protein